MVMVEQEKERHKEVPTDKEIRGWYRRARLRWKKSLCVSEPSERASRRATVRSWMQRFRWSKPDNTKPEKLRTGALLSRKEKTTKKKRRANRKLKSEIGRQSKSPTLQRQSESNEKNTHASDEMTMKIHLFFAPVSFQGGSRPTKHGRTPSSESALSRPLKIQIFAERSVEGGVGKR